MLSLLGILLFFLSAFVARSLESKLHYFWDGLIIFLPTFLLFAFKRQAVKADSTAIGCVFILTLSNFFIPGLPQELQDALVPGLGPSILLALLQLGVFIRSRREQDHMLTQRTYLVLALPLWFTMHAILFIWSYLRGAH